VSVTEPSNVVNAGMATHPGS